MADTLTIRFAEGQCQEGCGKQTAKGRRFVQGHDARLKSQLYKAARAGDSVKVNSDAAKPASAVITSFGWPQPAERKPRKKASAKPKSTAKSSAKKNAAKKADTKAA